MPKQHEENTMNDTITINGVEYAPVKKGNRAVIVIDRGWIAAGDVMERDGFILLSRAVWVFRWEKIGFDGVIANPEQADIRPFPNGFEVPAASEIFRVPVPDDWGL